MKNRIKIDENKCIGCGICAKTCRQSAIEMIDGKARVTRDDYCDGIGNCLPVCPVNAISFSKNSDSTDINKNENELLNKPEVKISSHKCQGSNSKEILRESVPTSNYTATSSLRQWPVQIKLVPVNAPYFNGAHLLIAADCAAYAYANFHQEFMRNKITLIGCPKLDSGDYTEKLSEIISKNNIKSVTAIRMEVPCCGGIENATVNALKASGKFIPWNVYTISTSGIILEN